MRASLVCPEVSEEDIDRNAREAQLLVVALQRVMDVLEDPTLSRLQMAERLAGQQVSTILYYDPVKG